MKRRYLIPEVIQTSAMDCGPAALKALFGGFGQYLSYGRLREACQTDVDGTSIDALEGIAQQLGLQVSQRMLPPDLLLLEQSACLPALIVVALPDGGTHVVVLWRVHGAWLQIMDPGSGRIWMHRESFLARLYRHEQVVSAAGWAEWSVSPEFTHGLAMRMRALGVSDCLWEDRAHHDAALRLGGALLSAGKLRRGAEARAFLEACAAQPEQIPDEYWAVRPCPWDVSAVLLRGAVLVGARGPVAGILDAALPDSLARARTEPAPRVWQPVWQAMQDSGVGLQAVCALGLVASAVGLVIEALLFRGLFDLGRHLESTSARVAGVAAMLVFLTALLALSWPTSLSVLRLGRQLEIRLRARLLGKIPRLEDRYFQSRSISDMAYRAHSLRLLRSLPPLMGRALNIVADLVSTGVAVAWVYPGTGLLVTCAVIAACLVPLLSLPGLTARDLRSREFGTALSSLYLQALLGARAIQAHGGESNITGLHAGLLDAWGAARLRQQMLIVMANATHMILSYGFIIALVYREALHAHSPAGLLLLVYWTISIPLLGQQVAGLAQALPSIRNTLLRFLELIAAPEADSAARGTERIGSTAPCMGTRIEFDRVSVLVAGHPVLDDISLTIEPGEQVAIVGVSGAGKSSLLGCLLGWYEPAVGTIRVDGVALTPSLQQQLRREIAWLDPQVQLFNTTLLDNIRYGNSRVAAMSMTDILQDADLDAILRRSADGLQTQVGENGALVSGGEGQRIRAARAFGRDAVRLALLDEPARGLGRSQRRDLLHAARRRFPSATLLCVTHDISDTLEFDRVIVIERGSVIEHGQPAALQARKGSRFAELLEIEQRLSDSGWAHEKWRRLRLEAGCLHDSGECRDPQDLHAMSS